MQTTVGDPYWSYLKCRKAHFWLIFATQRVDVVKEFPELFWVTGLKHWAKIWKQQEADGDQNQPTHSMPITHKAVTECRHWFHLMVLHILILLACAFLSLQYFLLFLMCFASSSSLFDTTSFYVCHKTLQFKSAGRYDRHNSIQYWINH